MPLDIADLIKQYATPGIDFGASAQAREAMTDRYAAFTRDPFADPFRDNEKQRYDAATQAAMNGASVAVGSNMGPEILSPSTMSVAVGNNRGPQSIFAPTMPTTPATAPLTTPVNMMDDPLSSSGNRAVDNSLLTSMLQAKGNQYQLARTDMQLPAPNALDYRSILDKRVALTGTTDLHNEITAANPQVFDQGVSADDPRFAKIGANGKVEAADSLHPVALTNRFVQEARQNPAKAAAYYHAVTNGRDYNTDVNAKSNLLAEQHDSRQKIIGGLKQITADPFTGALSEAAGVDPLTGLMRPARPLTPYETAIVNSEKGTSRETGVQLPDFGGLHDPGLTSAGNAEYRRQVQVDMAKGVPFDVAKSNAQKRMEATGKVATSQPTNVRPGVIRAADSLARFMGSGVNQFTQGVLNPQLGGGALTIPKIPLPTDQELDSNYQGQGNPTFPEVWQSILANLQEAHARNSQN